MHIRRQKEGREERKEKREERKEKKEEKKGRKKRKKEEKKTIRDIIFPLLNVYIVHTASYCL